MLGEGRDKAGLEGSFLQGGMVGGPKEVCKLFLRQGCGLRAGDNWLRRSSGAGAQAKGEEQRARSKVSREESIVGEESL